MGFWYDAPFHYRRDAASTSNHDHIVSAALLQCMEGRSAQTTVSNIWHQRKPYLCMEGQSAQTTVSNIWRKSYLCGGPYGQQSPGRRNSQSRQSCWLLPRCCPSCQSLQWRLQRCLQWWWPPILPLLPRLALPVLLQVSKDVTITTCAVVNVQLLSCAGGLHPDATDYHVWLELFLKTNGWWR